MRTEERLRDALRNGEARTGPPPATMWREIERGIARRRRAHLAGRVATAVIVLAVSGALVWAAALRQNPPSNHPRPPLTVDRIHLVPGTIPRVSFRVVNHTDQRWSTAVTCAANTADDGVLARGRSLLDGPPANGVLTSQVVLERHVASDVDIRCHVSDFAVVLPHPPPPPSAYFVPSDIAFWDAERGVAIGSMTTMLGLCSPDCEGAMGTTVDGGRTWDVRRTTVAYEAVHVIGRSEGWVSAPCDRAECFLHTSDGGTSWTPIDHDRAVVDPEFVTPLEGFALAAASNGSTGPGILETRDGGRTWSSAYRNPCPQATPDPQRIWFISHDAGWVNCVGEPFSSRNVPQILLRTVDGGATWSAHGAGACLPNGRLQFVDQEHGWSWLSPGMTSDGGNSWHEMRLNTDCELPATGWFFDTSHGFALLGVPAGTEAKLLRSDDGGVHWREVREWNSHADRSSSRAPAFAPSGVAFWDETHGLVVGRRGHFGEIRSTSDGGENWGVATFPRALTGLAVLGRSEAWVVEAGCICQNRVLHASDGGATWQRVTTDQSIASPSFLSSTAGFAVSGLSADPGVFSTVDGGATWTPITDPCAAEPGIPVPQAVSFVSERTGWLACRTDDHGTAMAGPKAVLVTRDGGRTWQAVSRLGVPGTKPSMGVGLPMNGDPNEIHFLPDGTGFLPFISHSLLATDDGGRTWTDLQVPARYDGSESGYSAWLIDDRTAYALTYVGGTGQLIRTDDGGTTWNRVTRYRY